MIAHILAPIPHKSKIVSIQTSAQRIFHCPTLSQSKSQSYLLSDYLIIGLPIALGKVHLVHAEPSVYTLTDYGNSTILSTSLKYICMYVIVGDTVHNLSRQYYYY